VYLESEERCANASFDGIVKFLIFDALRKIVSISFLFIFLSANTELHQLLRMPSLLQHFLEHKQADNSISFISFCKKHYAEENTVHAANHHDKHEKLPFKSHDCNVAHHAPVFAEPIAIQFEFPIAISNKNKMVISEYHYLSTELSNIWQPPKLKS
jgi:hypothetical protein